MRIGLPHLLRPLGAAAGRRLVSGAGGKPGTAAEQVERAAAHPRASAQPPHRVAARLVDQGGGVVGAARARSRIGDTGGGIGIVSHATMHCASALLEKASRAIPGSWTPSAASLSLRSSLSAAFTSAAVASATPSTEISKSASRSTRAASRPASRRSPAPNFDLRRDAEAEQQQEPELEDEDHDRQEQVQHEQRDDGDQRDGEEADRALPDCPRPRRCRPWIFGERCCGWMNCTGDCWPRGRAAPAPRAPAGRAS